MMLVREAPQRHNRRATWDNSPELRESVRDDLYEWGGAMRGGKPHLGFPNKAVFAQVPSKGGPSHDPDKVQAISDSFVLWNLVQQECGDAETREMLGRLQRALKLHFIAQIPAEASAKRMKTSRTSFYRMLGDAMYRFWVLHY
jgi:hypothetical protein